MAHSVVHISRGGLAIPQAALVDKLSEFLAVEAGGLRLYEAALQILPGIEVLSRFDGFYSQTRKHEMMLREMISALGGDPDYLSPEAEHEQEKVDSMLHSM